MIKRLLVYSILLSMALHCASRLGFIDHLYNNRNEIAFTIGLIAEIPIAMCNSDYDFGKKIGIKTSENSHTFPATVTKASHINLFIVQKYSHSHSLTLFLYKLSPITFIDLYKSALVKSVFHPPPAVV